MDEDLLLFLVLTYNKASWNVGCKKNMHFEDYLYNVHLPGLPVSLGGGVWQSAILMPAGVEARWGVFSGHSIGIDGVFGGVGRVSVSLT